MGQLDNIDDGEEEVDGGKIVFLLVNGFYLVLEVLLGVYIVYFWGG